MDYKIVENDEFKVIGASLVMEQVNFQLKKQIKRYFQSGCLILESMKLQLDII